MYIPTVALIFEFFGARPSLITTKTLRFPARKGNDVIGSNIRDLIAHLVNSFCILSSNSTLFFNLYHSPFILY